MTFVMEEARAFDAMILAGPEVAGFIDTIAACQYKTSAGKLRNEGQD